MIKLREKRSDAMKIKLFKNAIIISFFVSDAIDSRKLSSIIENYFK